MRSENLRGALFMMGSMAGFTLNDACTKVLSGTIPLFQLMFLRGVMTTLLFGAVVLILRKRVRAVSQRDRGLMFARALAEAATAYFFLTALFHMPLANITAILQAVPLTVTLCAAVWFHEPLGRRRLWAIAVGMCGVLLIIRPDADGFSIYALYGLGAVACITLRDLITRKISDQADSMLISFSTSFVVTLIYGGIGIGRAWVALDLSQLLLILGAALFIFGGYLFSVMVMRVGEVSFTAPFRYTGLVWALLLGWLVFDHWPDAMTMLGGAIVISSGIYMIYREGVQARRMRNVQEPDRG